MIFICNLADICTVLVNACDKAEVKPADIMQFFCC